MGSMALSTYAASAQTTAADTSGGGGWLSGLTNVFGSVATAFTNVYRTVNPPTPIQAPPGGVIYNPQTGTYVPAVPSVGISSGTLLLAGLGLLVVVLLVRG